MPRDNVDHVAPLHAEREPFERAQALDVLDQLIEHLLRHRLRIHFLYRAIKEYTDFFSQARPHQGIEQRNPEGIRSEGKENPKGKIIAFPVIHGLYHDYRRAA